MERNRFVRLKVALASVVLSSTIVSAQQAVPPAAAAIKSTPRAGRIESLINGVAVDGDRMPLKRASLRLRNLDTNTIEQTTTTNEAGEFSFAVRPGISYVVEIADQAGRVVAVGDVILASVGDVAGTVVALPSRLPALAGLFGDTASSVISAATGIGLTVVDPALPKLSPTR